MITYTFESCILSRIQTYDRVCECTRMSVEDTRTN